MRNSTSCRQDEDKQSQNTNTIDITINQDQHACNNKLETSKFATIRSSLVQDTVKNTEFQEETFLELIRDDKYRRKLNCKAVTWALNRLKFLQCSREEQSEILQLLARELAIKRFKIDQYAVRALAISSTQLGCELDKKMLVRIMDKAMDAIEYRFDDPLSLVLLMRFARKQGYQDLKVFYACVVQAVEQLIDGMNAATLVECMLELLCAKQFVPAEIFHKLGIRGLSLARSNQIEGCELSRLYAGLYHVLQPSLQVDSLKVMKELSYHLKSTIHQVDGRTACWVVSKNIEDRQLLQCFVDIISKGMQMNTVPLWEGASSANALARLNFYDLGFMDTLSKRLKEEQIDLNNKQIVQVLWAFTKLRHYDRQLLQVFEEICLSKLKDFSDYQLQIIVWAFAQFRVINFVGNPEVIKSSICAIQRCELRDYVRLGWVFAACGVQQKQFLDLFKTRLQLVDEDLLSDRDVFILKQVLLLCQMHDLDKKPKQCKESNYGIIQEDIRQQELQLEVYTQLLKDGWNVSTEEICEGLFRVLSIKINNKVKVLKVEGPQHFAQNVKEFKMLSSIVQDQLLESYDIVHIPFGDWEKVRSKGFRIQFLRQIIRMDSTGKID